MNNIRKILSLSFLFLFISLFFSPSVFSFGEYEDHEGNPISFKFMPKEKPSGEEERRVFISSFADNYKELKPTQIKPHFKTREDVTEWLGNVYTEEWDYLKKASHPVNLVDVFKGEKVVGFAIIEEWNNDVETLHIRQMAILPNEQRHGYGAALIASFKRLPEMPVKRIIADTRILNTKAREFYKKAGFSEDKPHDPELAGSRDYLGLIWSKPPELR